MRKTIKGNSWTVSNVVSHEVDDVNMLWYHRLASRMVIDGRTSRWKETHVLRMWTFPEFKGQLIANGFSDIRLFGSLKAGTREATTHAPHLVMVATKPPVA